MRDSNKRPKRGELGTSNKARSKNVTTFENYESDLLQIIKQWDELSEEIRGVILAIVARATQ